MKSEINQSWKEWLKQPEHIYFIFVVTGLITFVISVSAKYLFNNENIFGIGLLISAIIISIAIILPVLAIVFMLIFNYTGKQPEDYSKLDTLEKDK